MTKRYALIAGLALACSLLAIPLYAVPAALDDSPPMREHVSWLTMDDDGDGRLSADEVADTPWEDAFAAMDTDDNQQVTRKEFQNYMKVRNLTLK